MNYQDRFNDLTEAKRQLARTISGGSIAEVSRRRQLVTGVLFVTDQAANFCLISVSLLKVRAFAGATDCTATVYVPGSSPRC